MQTLADDARPLSCGTVCEPPLLRWFAVERVQVCIGGIAQVAEG